MNCSVNRAFYFVAEAKSYWFGCWVAEGIWFNLVMSMVCLWLTNNGPWLATFPTRLRTRLPTRQVPSVMYNFYAKKNNNNNKKKNNKKKLKSSWLSETKYQKITKKKKTEKNNEQIFEINKCTCILRKTQISNTIMIHASQTRPWLLPPPPLPTQKTAWTTTTITTTTTTTTVVRTT